VVPVQLSNNSKHDSSAIRKDYNAKDKSSYICEHSSRTWEAWLCCCAQDQNTGINRETWTHPRRACDRRQTPRDECQESYPPRKDSVFSLVSSHKFSPRSGSSSGHPDEVGSQGQLWSAHPNPLRITAAAESEMEKLCSSSGVIQRSSLASAPGHASPETRRQRKSTST